MGKSTAKISVTITTKTRAKKKRKKLNKKNIKTVKIKRKKRAAAMPRICFGDRSVDCTVYDDAQFLQAIQWDDTVQSDHAVRTLPALIEAAERGDVEQFSETLAMNRCALFALPKRKRLSGIAKEKMALWSQSAFGISSQNFSSQTVALIDIWQTNNALPALEKALTEWCDSGISTEASAAENFSPVELLLLHEMLLAVGRELSAALRWSLWRHTLETAMMLSAQLPEPSGSSATNDQRLLVAGELPFQAGLLFAGVKGAAELRQQAVGELSNRLLENSDTDGTPHAELIGRMPLWLAPFVRAKRWGKAFGEPCFNEKADGHYRELLQRTTAFFRADGQLMLGDKSVDINDEQTAFTIPLLTSALQSADFKKKSFPMRCLSDVAQFNDYRRSKSPQKFATALLGQSNKNGKKDNKKNSKKNGGKSARKNYRKDRSPATQSDWAHLACLRSDWSLSADAILVTHHENKPRIEMSALGLPIFSGEWEIDLTINGETVSPTDSWSCTCWFSDSDSDFLELQNEFANGFVVHRQILLSRTSQFALLADCVSSPKTTQQQTDEKTEQKQTEPQAVQEISYRQRLPLVDAVRGQADLPTREYQLHRDDLQLRVFPLALPEDRVLSAAGELSVGQNNSGQSYLELQQTGINGFYAPLLFDWSPRRQHGFAEWRTLTVAEDGRTLAAAEASGYRLRLGNHHLLVYRSLMESHFSRSILGQHIRHETMIGHFRPNGDVTPLLLVDY